MIFEQHGNLLSHISVIPILILQVIGSDPVERIDQIDRLYLSYDVATGHRLKNRFC